SEHTQLLSQSLDILHRKISNSSGTELNKRLTKEETLAVREPLIAVAKHFVDIVETTPDFVMDYRFDPLSGIAQQYNQLYTLMYYPYSLRILKIPMLILFIMHLEISQEIDLGMIFLIIRLN